MSKLYASVLLVLVAICATGCATQSPYAYGHREIYKSSVGLANAAGPQIERGERRPVLDAAGWVVGIPSKIILWDSRVDNHHVTDPTEAAIGEYLAANELTDVKVRLNQYAPVDEWRRLRANDAVGAGWRYTFGLVSVVGYAVFPGRLFGGDNYNPFTNTVNIYSDAPALTIHEGGHAKDFARRKWKGTYAAAYAVIPGFPLYTEAVASRDALAYVQENGSSEGEREAYRLLYPAYGTYIGGTIGNFTPASTLVYGVCVIGGHIAGRVRAAQVDDQREEPFDRTAPRTFPAATAKPTQASPPSGDSAEPLDQAISESGQQAVEPYHGFPANR